MSVEEEARPSVGISVPRRKTIGLANDHAGFQLKLFVKSLLSEYCDEVIDVGTMSDTPVDFLTLPPRQWTSYRPARRTA